MNREYLDVIVPGSLLQQTGGYIYDRRMVQGLSALGWHVVVHELEGRFPDSDRQAHKSLSNALESIGDGCRVLIDGLAMGSLPCVVRTHINRLRILSLVHHPLSDEFGLAKQCRERLRTLEHEALRACLGVVVTSRFTASRLASFGIPPNLIRWVAPGLDQVELAQGVPEGAPLQLLCVASVTPRKGQDVLVRALEKIRELPWRCVIAGSLDRDRVYVDSVFRLVERLDIGSRVEFLGECDDLALSSLYDQSSIFVLSSYFEGYGMVLTEALARGLPVVSTTGGAIVDTVPVDAGLLVKPGDENALAEALSGLLRNRSRRKKLSMAARIYAQKLASWKEASANFSDAVLELAPQLPGDETLELMPNNVT